MLGEKIRECRIYWKIPAKDLAEKLNVTKSTVSSWENGNSSPKPEQIRKIAEILGVPTDYLLEAGPFENFDLIIKHKDEVIREIARVMQKTSYGILYGLDIITFIRLVGAYDIRVIEHPGEDGIGISSTSIPTYTGNPSGSPEYQADQSWLRLIHSLNEMQQRQLKGYADCLAQSGVPLQEE